MKNKLASDLYYKIIENKVIPRFYLCNSYNLLLRDLKAMLYLATVGKAVISRMGSVYRVEYKRDSLEFSFEKR